MDPQPRFNNLPPDAFRPAYVREIVFVGGDFGNDVDIATASSTDDYAPRHQYARSQQENVGMADDVGKDYGEFSGEMTRTGTVEPFMPYPTTPPPEPEPPAAPEPPPEEPE